MKQRKHFFISKQKSYLTAGVIALVAVITMAGICNRDRKTRQETEREAVVMAGTEDAEDTAYTADADPGAEADSETAGEEEVKETMAGTIADAAGETQAAEAASGQPEETISGQLAETESEQPEEAEAMAQAEEPQLHFSAADRIGWPINGDVILNYSMDKSVYFATLDQYKYNPAVIIRGAVNDKVLAAADGQVISVETGAETGETVTVGLGDGYQMIYGQLKEVPLSAGDFISRGDTVGFIGEPTKYYAVEGSNLYFAMQKDGSPVNPLDYFE